MEPGGVPRTRPFDLPHEEDDFAFETPRGRHASVKGDSWTKDNVLSDISRLQLRCHELGLSSIGTRTALLERMRDHVGGHDRAPCELRGRGHSW